MNQEALLIQLTKLEELLSLDFFKFIHNKKDYEDHDIYNVSFEFLNKLIRVSYHRNGHTSVIGFIVNCEDYKKFNYGDLLKASSYKTPALNFKRGNLFELKDNQRIAWTGF